VALVDVVIVSYNSAARLAWCVEPLLDCDDVRVVVVDNASEDETVEVAASVGVEVIPRTRNDGFAAGCNTGFMAGAAPSVLLLNPDARIEAADIERLLDTLRTRPDVGVVAPRIVAEDGSLEFSQRRFPRLRSTYAQALFLHRVFRQGGWTDELLRDVSAYERPGSPDWVSGACILLRRTALEQLGGLDEGFFMYCEDIDLCKRLRDVGFEIAYEPGAQVVHQGGVSAPRSALLPVLAQSRLRYARKHRSRPVAELERLGIAIGAATHALVSPGRAVRAGHARALRLALFHPSRSADPSQVTRVVRAI
jgi:N-acetylglucosaminyl-diphospho-decaprenol L-rhamnosyltransferase